MLTGLQIFTRNIAEIQSKPPDVLSVSGSTVFDQSSSVSEVYQEEEIDKSGMLDPKMAEYVLPLSSS